MTFLSKKNVSTIFLLSLFMLLQIACKNGKAGKALARLSNKANNKSTSTSTAIKANVLKDKAALTKAQQDLLNLPKFKGKDLKVFQNVRFYADGRILIEIEDPTKAGNVDHYEYNGSTWSEPQPVRISGNGDMKTNTTAMNKIKFDLIPKMYDTWMKKAKTIEGATEELDYIYFNLWVPSQSRYWATSNIEGSREEYSLDFNLDGSIKEFEKR